MIEPAGDLVVPGDVIADKYRVKAVIGRGGVGVVVAADHLTLRRPVAIKLLRPEIAHDPEVIQRFLREARATAQLRSEHVARVMDADKIEGGPAYLVMELLSGRDFGAILKEDGPLPVEVAADAVVQACEAVGEAHAAGIIHRDLKPANLFRTEDASGKQLVKVLDFGLSKIESGDSRTSLTSANHVMGSPHYMSPEQMRSSRDADARSDIWALGVVLYTMLTGRVPFKGTYLTEVCAAVLSGSAPSITTLRPGLPPGLVDVVGRCMRLEPADRFQSVAELVAALTPYAQLDPADGQRTLRAAAASPAPPAVPTPAPAMLPVVVAARLAPSSEPRSTPLPQRARLRWSLLFAGVAVVVGGFVFLRRASPAADPAPPPAGSASSAVEEPESTASDTTVATASAAPPVDSPTRVRGALRHPPVPGGRKTAPATAHSGPPKAEEDLILGLPH